MLRALREQRRLLAGAGVFACGILLLTKLDFIINSTFYSYGLKFSMDWYWQYSVVYFVLLQCFAVGSFLLAHRRELLILAEAFVLSGTQDLVYFGVWNGGVFPPGQWNWTPYYWMFGSWTTAHQVALSVSSLIVAGSIIAILWWRAVYIKKPARRRRRQKAAGRRQ
jgi:hypothetical protein